MQNNFEISLVVFMPNITTNHAITYTYISNVLQLTYQENCRFLEISAHFSIVSDDSSPGGGVLPYMGYIGMCRWEGYGFQAVYSSIGYINQSV